MTQRPPNSRVGSLARWRRRGVEEEGIDNEIMEPKIAPKLCLLHNCISIIDTLNLTLTYEWFGYRSWHVILANPGSPAQ
jgi:hypothetical protein